LKLRKKKTKFMKPVYNPTKKIIKNFKAQSI
jgi:hypothetical protein